VPAGLTVSARSRAFTLLAGFTITQALGTLARLGIADLVAERPRTVAELADAASTDAATLGRLLRAVAAAGFYTTAGGVVHHTELSELLRPDAEGSIHWHALLFTGLQWPVWGAADASFRTGEPAFEQVYGERYFDWFERHPEDADVFNRAMAASAAARLHDLLAWDWSAASTVVDVGGGTGVMLAAVLAAHPHLHGLVFDLEHARAGAEATIAEAGLTGRCAFSGGSFFEAVPPGADVYVLSHILHDWGDDEALTILRACRAAAADTSRLLVVEGVVRDGDEPDWRKVLDLHMLLLLGGCERSEEEWRSLLARGGFALQEVVEGRGGGLLEAAPA
jgi:hypothetical protein